MSHISEAFAATADAARRATMAVLCPELGDFRLTAWDEDTLDYLWENPAFPWLSIRRQYIDPDRLELALWAGDRLVALGICETMGDVLVVRVLEGAHDDACPFTGARAFIMTDAAMRYAQLRGKREVHLQPVSSDLVNLYVQGCGFSPPDPSTGSPYYWKKVKP